MAVYQELNIWDERAEAVYDAMDELKQGNTQEPGNTREQENTKKQDDGQELGAGQEQEVQG